MPKNVANLIDKLPKVDGFVFGSTVRAPKINGNKALMDGVLFEKTFKLQAEQGKPVTTSVAKPEHLHEILATQFPGVSLRAPEDFDDTDYYLPPLAVVQAVFAERQKLTADIGYWPEVFDCDDFAYCLKALFSLHRFRTANTNEAYTAMAAGMLWGGEPDAGHVVNVAVTADAGVYIVDLTPPLVQPIYSAVQWQRPARYIVI